MYARGLSEEVTSDNGGRQLEGLLCRRGRVGNGRALNLRKSATRRRRLRLVLALAIYSNKLRDYVAS